MRIIAGKFKSKKILFPIDRNTRPLRDLVKESIFNLIENSNKFDLKINHSNILDLFSGSGSFGFECISRGAEKVIFFENYSQALKILKKNIKILKVDKNCKVIEENCFNYVQRGQIDNSKFDIIFLDPPFKEKNINILINRILEKRLLTNNGLMIIHRHKKDDLKISDKFRVLDTRFYGVSKIMIGC